MGELTRATTIVSLDHASTVQTGARHVKGCRTATIPDRAITMSLTMTTRSVEGELEFNKMHLKSIQDDTKVTLNDVRDLWEPLDNDLCHAAPRRTSQQRPWGE